MFNKFVLDLDDNVFKDLSTITEFEDICKGRKGAILVDYKNDLIPIVRTTTVYKKSVQQFTNIHHNIIHQINKKYDHDIKFNNAMIEIYDPTYRKMKFHTDQSLDLKDNSYICLFSCYDDQHTVNDFRKLKIQNKLSEELSEVLLENNSVVIFSTLTNQNFRHKIVLESNKGSSRWLGITFRLSKTFVNFVNGKPYINSSKLLRLANLDERKEFFKHKGDENKSIGYDYPEIDYTISDSDLLPIV